MKTIGILGGMGPQATADLFLKIINNTDAVGDAQHPHVLIDSNSTIPSRLEAIMGRGPSPVGEMVKSAKRLESAGADFIVIACNTAHYYYSEVQNAVGIPVLNILDITAEYCSKKGIKKVGLLATDMLLKLDLYGAAFRKHGVEVLVPERADQKSVMEMIFDGIKAGKKEFDTTKVTETINTLQKKEAETIVLGCTELPVAFELYNIDCDFVDPTTLIAREAVKLAGANVR